MSGVLSTYKLADFYCYCQLSKEVRLAWLSSSLGYTRDFCKLFLGSHILPVLFGGKLNALKVHPKVAAENWAASARHC